MDAGYDEWIFRERGNRRWNGDVREKIKRPWLDMAPFWIDLGILVFLMQAVEMKNVDFALTLTATLSGAGY